MVIGHFHDGFVDWKYKNSFTLSFTSKLINGHWDFSNRSPDLDMKTKNWRILTVAAKLHHCADVLLALLILLL